MPAIRRSDQLWALHNSEALTYTRFLSGHNITSSYRTDSDIYVPYGRIVKTNQTINHSINKINFNNKWKLVFGLSAIVWLLEKENCMFENWIDLFLSIFTANVVNIVVILSEVSSASEKLAKIISFIYHLKTPFVGNFNFK